MLENEEPWNPPKPQSVSNMPKVFSQVPEVTILFNKGDAKEKKTVASFPKTTTATHLVPDLSIINDDSQIKGQTHESASEEIARETQPMRQGLLVEKPQTSYDYKPNPLSKYMPSKITTKTGSSGLNVGNLSSILIDMSSQPHERSLTEQNDLQLKNVAGILSEIQKLITPSKANGENYFNTPQRSNVVLRKLAKMYLSDEEYSFYAIDEELSK